MNLHGAASRGSRRRSGDRGATAVEAAIVTPVVMAMLFGIIEFGFFFKDYLAVAGGVRAGVRLASANPRNSSFAQNAADKVAASGQAMSLKDVQQLWVYKVDAVTDKPAGFSDFSDCTTCVKFTWDAGTKTFVTNNINGWLASSQNACSSSSMGGPPDRIGVYIQLRHNAFTGLVFNTINISEASIMTLEPMPVLTGCK